MFSKGSSYGRSSRFRVHHKSIANLTVHTLCPSVLFYVVNDNIVANFSRPKSGTGSHTPNHTHLLATPTTFDLCTSMFTYSASSSYFPKADHVAFLHFYRSSLGSFMSVQQSSQFSSSMQPDQGWTLAIATLGSISDSCSVREGLHFWLVGMVLLLSLSGRARTSHYSCGNPRHSW